MSRWRALSRKSIIAVAASCLGALFAFAAHAQVDLGINYATALGLGTQDIRTTISRIISYFLGFLGIIAVVLVLYAGFLWMTSQGNEEQVSKAKRLLASAVIGLVIILSAYAIASFVLRGAGGGGPVSSGTCAPGQVCASGAGGLGGGAAGGFRISGVAPSGAGPNQGGWPKNFGITVGFNAILNGTTVTDKSFLVKRCNPRVNGAGVTQPFDFTACTTDVAGTRSADGSRVVFKPNATSGANQTDFEGNFWYYVLVRGGAIRDTRNRALLCPFRAAGALGDPSSPQVQRDLCERAIAINDQRDTQPPTVAISVPHSPPAFCAQRIKIQATANDDFLVSEVSFRLNGGTVGLVDVDGTPFSSVVNADGVNPLVIDAVYIDTSVIPAGGSATLTAIAQDGVPQSSAAASATVSLNPPTCCNGIQDPNETGVDCGAASGCGACAGGSCTTDAQCASGFCNAQSGKCEDRPIIDDVSPVSGAVGTLVTIKGRSFGSVPGKVVFLGGDTDGNGDPKGDSDDVTATACASAAWSGAQVVVAVPQNAKSGPIELVTAAGPSDRTDKDPGWQGAFTVNDQVRPGICTLEPDNGSSGTAFTIRGSGFGTVVGESAVFMNGQPIDVAQGGWGTDGSSVRALAPSIADGAYPVKIRVGAAQGGAETNSLDFSLRAPADAAQLRVTDIIPSSGPPGTYVTIVGSGFGTRKGTVRFTFGSGITQDVATGDEPACAENWHPNYVVVKVPSHYDKTSPTTPLSASPAGVAHAVSIVTSAGRQSNVVGFAVKTGTPGPGLCAITPDNGPAGKTVSIDGEGFGDRPSNATPTSSPRFTVEFFKDATKHCLVNAAVACTTLGDQCTDAALGACVPNSTTASAYGTWSGGRISVAVPGSKLDKTTWPKSGPVYVIADNRLSTNAVPFTIGDCNDAGGDKSCPADAGHCCANGSCQASCQAQAKASAYGWKLSTEVLPAVPIVLERSICDIKAGAMQSPSPFKDSRDACRNAVIYVEFNKALDGGISSLAGVANFTLLDCGTGDAADCSAKKAVPFTLTPERGGEAVTITPSASFTRNTWYHVSLLSDVRDPKAQKGLHDPQGQFLDGDFDGNQGGDYAWNFHVRDSDQACELANVIVNPAGFTVDHEDEPGSVPAPPNAPPGTAIGFASDLLAANCNLLQCLANQDPTYTVGWNLSDDPLAALRLRPDLLLPPGPQSAAGVCLTRMAVTATKETPPGSPATLTAVASATGSPTSKSAEAKVAVKFADPVVVAFEPDCTEACVNARISATFNILMNAASLTAPGNAQIFRCRNATCNPPYEATLGDGTVRTASAVTIDKKTKKVEFIGTKLQKSSFYIVKLRGGDKDGIVSASGVPLTGLNDGKFFTWIFKTKDDGSPCSVDRASVDPASSNLFFVGERSELAVTPFGAPDECNPNGQALEGGDYNWGWSQSEKDDLDEGVVGSFLKAAVPQSTLAGTLDTGAAPVGGCSERCLNTGSQNRIPQCGNGIIENGEGCERDQFANGCSPTTCTFLGVAAPACGNGQIDAGEECDKVSDVFPPGCKDPAVHVDGWADGVGCVHLGAKSGGSQCGDSFVGDGEACDDGNKVNGDGCSADCLNEGTLPSCVGLDPASGAQCINFCGNGITEPGEDTGCDTPTGIASGCSRITCLKNGTSTCSGVNGVNCCGNGKLDQGEQCETTDGSGRIAQGGELPSSCSAHCLFKGSSGAYPDPSFCRDGILGAGENPRCDGPSVAGAAPDTRIDPVQVVAAGYLETSQVVVRPDGSTGAEAVVTAAVPEISSEDKKGKANVSLSCTCGKQADPQRFCAAIGAAQDPKIALGCSSGGCCAPAPQLLLPTFPVDGSDNACRNTIVRLTFDGPIDETSAKAHVVVGEGVQGASCGTVCSSDLHTACDPRSSVAEIETICGKGASCVARRQLAIVLPGVKPVTPHGSFLERAWQGISSFFQGLLGSETSAAGVPTNPPLTYCAVPGTVSVSNNVVTWSPSFSFTANTWTRVLVEGGNNGVRGTNDVPMAASQNIYFQTGAEICRMDRVILLPTSQLFTRAEDLGPPGTPGDRDDGDQEFTARAHPAGRPDGAEIASTPDYEFKWNWTLSLQASSIVVQPTSLAPIRNGFCEDGESPTAPDCAVNLASASSPKPAPGCGNAICESGETAASCPIDCRTIVGQEDKANVSVRRTGTGFPKNGEDTVTVAADISERGGLDKSRLETTADVVVLLCENPWPDRRECSADGQTSVPWDKTNPDGSPKLLDCAAGQPAWFPFYDPGTQVSFYYCRDTQKKGDETPLLPALKEDAVRVVPGRDIIREYLLTFAAAATPQSWSDDAIGFRIVKNADHFGARNWYAAQGFTGAPQSTTVDGYDALKEGRTTYVAAAAKSGTSLFTNVDVFSFNDGAASETKNVFSQISENLNLNRNVKDRAFCINGTGAQACVDAQGRVAPCGPSAPPVACGDDRDCRVAGSDVTECSVGQDGKTTCAVAYHKGQFVPERSHYTCANYKSKIIRDVHRIADLQAMRSTLIADKVAGFPTLESGSFLRGISESAWPSWTGALATDSGRTFPQDPLNTYMNCAKSPETPAAGAATLSPKSQRFGFPVFVTPSVPSCSADGGPCTFDPNTCFSAKDVRYMCPVGSHVYEYRGTGGVDFRLGVDLEVNDTMCASFENPLAADGGESVCNLQQDLCVWSEDTATCHANVSWLAKDSTSSGATCIAKDPASCAADPTCTFDGTSCQFKEGKVVLGGYTGGDLCQTVVIGDQGRCGDGVVQSNEECEPGMTQSVTCAKDGRTGALDQFCTASCAWTDVLRCAKATDRRCATDADCGTNGPCGASCGIGSCGDGVKQPTEICDDGRLNGSYGHCNATCQGLAFYCGDGQKQPNEACDCGAANGAYAFNGVLQKAGDACAATVGITGSFNTAGALANLRPQIIPTLQTSSGTSSNFQVTFSVNSCAFDCSGPAPRCGDAIINGSEQCDGGFEEFKGFCGDGTDDPKQTGCNDDNQCNFGRCVSGQCAGNNGISCVRDSDCAKKCGNFCPRSEQLQRRVCGTNDPAIQGDDVNACKWSLWHCTAPGTCGNGRVDQGEACDDGNQEDNDGCTNVCKLPVCGDGFVSQGSGEECDDGSENGTACVPGYGGTCNFCTGACKVGTVSGGYCGNNVLEGPTSSPSGPEQCEGVQGIAGYACISTRPEDLSKGKKVGDSFCAASCQRACPANAVVCANLILGTSATADTDSDSIVDICDPDVDNDNVPAQFDCNEKDPAVHGEYKYNVNSPGHCTGSPPGQPISCTRDGDCIAIGRGTCIDRNKCGPGSTTSFGPVCDVPAAVEVCDNGKDNNCDGKVDNVYLISGTVQDAQTGLGLGGITVNALCNAAPSASGAERIAGMATTGSDGTFLIHAVDDNCDGTFRVYVPSDSNVLTTADGANYCSDNSQRIIASFQPQQKCGAPKDIGLFEVTKAPEPGQYRAVLTWGNAPPAPTDLDLHGRDNSLRPDVCNAVAGEPASLPDCKSDAGRLANRCTSSATCYLRGHAYWDNPTSGVFMRLDHDAVHYQGPETITITPRLGSGISYRMYVDWYSFRSSTGVRDPSTTPDSGHYSDPAVDAEVRLWDQDCNLRLFSRDASTSPLGPSFSTPEMKVPTGETGSTSLRCSNNASKTCTKNSDCYCTGTPCTTTVTPPGAYCQIPHRYWFVFTLTQEAGTGPFTVINRNVLESSEPPTP